MALYCFKKSVRTADGFNRPIRSLSRLFRGITANNNGDFYCLGCLHSFQTDNALKRQERLYDNDYCHLEMPTKDNKNIKMQSWRKIIKSNIHNLCWFRMLTNKRVILSKQS